MIPLQPAVWIPGTNPYGDTVWRWETPALFVTVGPDMRAEGFTWGGVMGHGFADGGAFATPK